MLNRVVAVNGSPNAEKGITELILKSFLSGMEIAGLKSETIHLNKYTIKACSCNRMFCWYEKPGNCCIGDDMQLLIPKLRNADILVLATPVYIPLPGKFQDFLNRLCPIILPKLQFKNSRTRAEFRDNVKIKKVVLVATGGWWEPENLEIVVQIIKEFAMKSGTEFGGAVLRPHGFLMRSKGNITEAGKNILLAAEKAGNDLIKNGTINQDLLDEISRPLISEEALRNIYNGLLTT